MKNARKRKGIWYADFWVDEQRFRYSLHTGDWREASKKVSELMDLARQGKLTPQTVKFSRLPFPEAVDRWLEERKPRIAAKTYVTEKERAGAPKRFFGQTKVKKITTEAVLAYMRRRSGEGIANGTINRELDVIRGALKRAKLWNRFEDDVKPLPARSNVGRALAPDEKARLLRIAASKAEWQTGRLATLLTLNTTCRACELKGLRWRDVDLLGRTITIRRSKTEAGIRTIPLNAVAYRAVLELRERSKALFGPDLNPDWYVFFTKEGFSDADPARPMAFGWRKAWRAITQAIDCPECGLVQPPAKACQNAECKADIHNLKSPLAGLRFHDLRHHAITELAESQASEQTVLAIAGHVSKEMLRHYSHVRQQAMRQALDALAGGTFEGGSVTHGVTKSDSEPAVIPQVIEKIGGPHGIRTHGLLVANEALSQLS
jgi:integrase